VMAPLFTDRTWDASSDDKFNYTYTKAEKDHYY